MASNAGFLIPIEHMGHMGGDMGGGSILQNIRELGLKLEGRKAPMGMLVVDHLEKEPTEN